MSKVKIEIVSDYYDTSSKRDFKVGEVYNVEDNPNSVFYHLWSDNDLSVILKDKCKVIR